MDFYQICTKELKSGDVEVYPNFIVNRSKDLMIRGHSFYAIWDEAKGVWSTDEYDVQRLVDEDLHRFADEQRAKSGRNFIVKSLRSFDSNHWTQYRKFVATVADNSHPLDMNLVFANTETKKTDYSSRRLPYALEPGDFSAWDELIGTLYSVEERAKIEWVIGAIVSGDSKKIQKFLVLYGPAGTGKSTVLNIVQKLFDGYVATFEAKALGTGGSDFAMEAFKSNPLVAIQHDGDLSRISDNTKLNSIIAHESMSINEKYKAAYSARIDAFLLMGTNQPVKITDAKSGIIRRLIDAHPTGVRFPANHYHTLMAKTDFELGAIAYHCLQTYLAMGKNYYNGYKPLEMMLQTDIFFNFIEAHFDVFKSQNGTTLKQAYALYKTYCNDTGIEKPLPMYKIREELRNYFDDFHEREEIGGEMQRSVYLGFNANKFKTESKSDKKTFSLVIEETESLLDEEFADQPAQLANENELPYRKWERVSTTLADIDTTKLHFVKIPEQHIVIDFDLKDQDGVKSLERNLEAASNWPATYAELSKGGSGVHLHYNYEGDVSMLSSVYSEGIEIKTLLGDASLRRRLSKCNHVPIATLKGGLPVKEKKMLNDQTIKSEKGLRDLIARNLRKEIHPGTKPSVDFIKKILDEAYESGLPYNVTDLRAKIMAFANNSTHQPFECLKLVQQMKFQSEVSANEVQEEQPAKDDRISYYDVEVYPNLFVIVWKFAGDNPCVRMINPSPQEVESLIRQKLVGFNCRRYDNHILWARLMGYDNLQLFKLSQKLIQNDKHAAFGEAYNLSYADVWDYSSIKKSLKKFQVDLGIQHKELDFPWDQPVPEEFWEEVVDYCCNDVISTEKVAEDRAQDLVARQILAELSGLSVNDTTQKHTARIIFGLDRNPQAQFVYTDLSKDFPGYTFDLGKSLYRGEDPGEGGYVYAEPGMYENVALLDVASMHPTSIEQLDLFGPYTPNYSALKAARMAIKHGDYDSAKTMLGGKLAPFLKNPEDAKQLSYALKIVINIVYGLTSAKFDNPFRDVRNKDNIVAKRGALFMIDLKHAVQEQGFTVAHIKTDSIKIPNATPEIIEFVTEFGKKYGYDFEHEATYDKFCLVNDAVYVAKKGDKWEAVGAQFQHPYVFKMLFSHEPIEYKDLFEAKHVTQGTMYLDFEHDRPIAMVEGMKFVGRSGLFIPVVSDGGVLYRVKDEKLYAVTGTKGYLWQEADMAVEFNPTVDMSYYEKLLSDATATLNKFGEVDWFLS